MERAHPGSRTRGWVIGRAAGAPVVVSPGWLLAAAVLTVLFAPTARAFSPGIGAGAYAVAAAFVILLFVSVFLHELAHALVARRRGVVVRELAITLLGGHTQFGAAAPTPATSALVAAAGPAANLAIAGVAAVCARLLPGDGVLALLVLAAAVANGFVGVFNLVPGLPLDGGRVLEAVVWRGTGRRSTGTVVAGWVGRAVAVGFVTWVLLVPFLAGDRPSLTAVVWGALIGAFLWSGADQAIRAGRSDRAVESLALHALMSPAVGLPADGSLAEAMGRAGGGDVVLLADDRQPVAYLDRAALASVPAERWPRTPLSAVAVPLPAGAAVRGTLRGSAAVQAVAAASRLAPVMAVLDDAGRVVGLLRAQDVVTALRHRP